MSTSFEKNCYISDSDSEDDNKDINADVSVSKTSSFESSNSERSPEANKTKQRSENLSPSDEERNDKSKQNGENLDDGSKHASIDYSDSYLKKKSMESKDSNITSFFSRSAFESEDDEEDLNYAPENSKNHASSLISEDRDSSFENSEGESSNFENDEISEKSNSPEAANKGKSSRKDSFDDFGKENEIITSSPCETKKDNSHSKKTTSGIESSLNSSNSRIGNLNDSDSEPIQIIESSGSHINGSASIIEDSLSRSQFTCNKLPTKAPEEDEVQYVIETSDSEVEMIESVNVSRPSAARASNTRVEESKFSNYGSDVFDVEDNSDVESVKSSTSVHSVNSASRHSSMRSNSSTDRMETKRQILERQIADKKTAHNNLMRAFRSCDPKKLKDGGRLLEDNMRRCQQKLKELQEELKNLPETEDENVSPVVLQQAFKPNSLFSTKDQVTSNLGKKGLETHRVQSALTVDALVTLHSSLSTCPSEDTLEKDPRGLNVELMPHQKYALSWLLWREKQTPPGGILADDMGLGKTLTTIALVLRSNEYKKENGTESDDEDEENISGSRTYRGNTLVVCPASLIGQWENQIKQHCRRNILKVLVHHGKPRILQAKVLAEYDIVITTYGVVLEENKILSGKNRKGALLRVRWERVVLDEAHVVRNPKTRTSTSVCDLTAKHRWCLTGTPVHNKELDIYALLKFLQCRPFDDLLVWKRWVDNKSANGVQRLNTVVKSILLRRTKEDLKLQGSLNDLPGKELIPVYVELGEDELKVYQKVLHFSKSLLAQYLHQRQEKLGVTVESFDRARDALRKVGEIKTSEILVLLLRLRQICCLPGLIHSMLEEAACETDGIEAEDRVMEDLYSQVKRLSLGAPRPVQKEIEVNNVENILVTSNPVFDKNRASEKIKAVLNIIEQVIDTNDKIVIVSQWSSLLRILEHHISLLKIKLVTLDGSVPIKNRTSIIQQFNDETSRVKIMLLSLNAGGVGLNLVGGNRLIIFEPHWNPQLESQACDRIYRVGQKKSVFVYKVICKDTIEERIEFLQKKKKELADNVLKGELKTQVSKLTLQDLQTLFELEKRV